MDLWRINLKPGSEQGIDAAQFCIDRGIVGVGWRVEPAPANKDDYWRLGRERYCQRGRRSWSSAATVLLYKLAPNDLIWTRNRAGAYFLGRIVGDWEYRTGDEYTKADIINVRPCEWVHVGTMDNVPGAVINGFRPNRTVQRVKSSSALLFSRYLYAKLRGEDLPAAGTGEADVLGLLSPEDLEDVVAVYLQVVKRYIMFPSTCKTDTMAVECLFASPEDGRRVGVQVKSGRTAIDRDDYLAFDGTMYLFAASGQYRGSPNPRCVCLAPDEMRSFVYQNRRIMPGRIQRWVEFAEATAPR